jgi:predicted DNA-binding protein (MmcQ/YjbR family)
MTLERYNAFCASLPHTSHVVQWGGAHVWKVAGKVFAIAWPEAVDQLHVTFKCSPMSFELLKTGPGMRPAPYLASRGMSWLQRTSNATLSDDELEAYLKESYRLVALGFSRKKLRQLGISA